MTSQAEKLRQQAEKIRQRQAAAATETEPHVATPRRGAAAPLSRPVRRTVDLSPSHHAQLAEWCRETARQLGRARVTGQDVLRALVARVLTDETLARKIRADLRSESQ